jgi:hypothetical protein
MSYLLAQATRRPTRFGRRARAARIDERITLNLPDFDGGAHVRVYVEDTRGRRRRFGRAPVEPRIRLRVADCINTIALEFSVDTAETRENSMHKIDTLLDALRRFRVALADEAALRGERERQLTT